MSWLTLCGSNYPYLEQISMVPKVFELLRFDCIPSRFTAIFTKETTFCDFLFACLHIKAIWTGVRLFPYRIDPFLGGREKNFDRSNRMQHASVQQCNRKTSNRLNSQMRNTLFWLSFTFSRFRIVFSDPAYFCLCWGFTAQSTQWGHVERGQFT